MQKEISAVNEEGPAPVGPVPISVSEADVSGQDQTGKVSLSACNTYIAADRQIQDENVISTSWINRIAATVSAPRISRYNTMAGGDKRLAVRLHTWNAAVAASLLPSLHLTEVSIRNLALVRVRAFYGANWYSSLKLVRKLGGETSSMALTLACAYADEVRLGRAGDLSNFITSELPFGFWVNVFTSKFANELWNRPLHTYCSSFPRGATLATIHEGVDDVRKIRNNVAHHKNLVCKPVEHYFSRTIEVLSWFCPPSSELAKHTSTFPAVWTSRPEALAQ